MPALSNGRSERHCVPFADPMKVRSRATLAILAGSAPVLAALGVGTGSAEAVTTATAVGGAPGLAAFPVGAWLAHWWVFPAAVLFSLVALAAGVSSALFFSPFFLLVVGLSPVQAIGAGLLTMVFGMGNGMRSYVRQGVVDYATVRWLLVGALPAVVAGAYFAHHVPATLLRALFGVGLFGLAALLLYYDPPDTQTPGAREGPFLAEKNAGRGRTVVETAEGERLEFDTCWRPPGVAMSVGGGLLTGLVSAGLPEILTTQLVVRCRLPPRVAVATSVVVAGIATVAGALVHALAAAPVWFVVAWSVPGVLVGSTVGTRVGKYLPSELLQPALGSVFALVGVLVLVTTFLV